MVIAIAVALLIAFLSYQLWDEKGQSKKLLVLLSAQLEKAQREREKLADDAAAERRSLADRIQHPQRIQVQPVEDYTPPEPSRDAAELAWVGEIVPDYVSVGEPDQQETT